MGTSARGTKQSVVNMYLVSDCPATRAKKVCLFIHCSAMATERRYGAMHHTQPLAVTQSAIQCTHYSHTQGERERERVQQRHRQAQGEGEREGTSDAKIHTLTSLMATCSPLYTFLPKKKTRPHTNTDFSGHKHTHNSTKISTH